jgi:hypothetical protein
MTCSLVARLLPLHAGGDLPGALGRWVEAHAGACAACARELGSLRSAMRPLGRIAKEQGRAARVDRDAALARPDPLGDNFWLEIRRDLRSEGLVRRPDEVADARRRAPAPRGISRGLAGRALAAAAAAIVAGFVFLPSPIVRAPDPGDTARLDAPIPDMAKLTTDPTAVRAGLRGVSVFPAAMPGALEETQSFGEPDVEYGLERWRSGADEKASKPEKEKGSLSF